MKNDYNLIYEEYRKIHEQDSTNIPALKKLAISLGLDPGNLTQDQVDRLIYDQKRRDVSFGGFQAVKDFNSQKADPKYTDGVATVLPYDSTKSPERIQLDLIRRLDGAQPGDPLTYYNTKNPNWFFRAYNDEKRGLGPFDPNWNYDSESSRSEWQKDRPSTPTDFHEIYRNPFNDQNEEPVRGFISTGNNGSKGQTYGTPSIPTTQGAKRNGISGISDIVSGINQIPTAVQGIRNNTTDSKSYKHDTTKKLLDAMGN